MCRMQGYNLWRRTVFRISGFTISCWRKPYAIQLDSTDQGAFIKGYDYDLYLDKYLCVGTSDISGV